VSSLRGFLDGGVQFVSGGRSTRAVHGFTGGWNTFTNYAGVDAIFGPLTDQSLGLLPAFSLTGGTCATSGRVAAGDACTLVITFTPQERTSIFFSFQVNYTWAGSGLAGTVQGSVQAASEEPFSISDRPAFHFGPLSIGSNATKIFTVTNWHDEDVLFETLNDEALGLEVPFSLNGGTCLTGVAPSRGGQCTLAVQFSPTNLGVASDQIELRSRLRSGAVQATLALPLTAAGVVRDPVIALARGTGLHNCAVLASGALRCWGYNASAQLGYGHVNNIGDDEFPASAGDVNIGGRVVQVAPGGQHTCALLETGRVRCWGGNRYGALGYGHLDTIGDDELPATAGDVNVGESVVQISAGNDHTCALLATGNVRCWGRGWTGALGYGNTRQIGDDEPPAAGGNVPIGAEVRQISAGSFHTCALLATGAVRCWGLGEHGRLGYGNTSTIGDDELPSSAGDIALGGPALRVSAGTLHTCALLVSGAVRCWGAGFYGRLGYGNTSAVGDDELPSSAGDVQVGGLADDVQASANHTCALLVGGSVRCWGHINGLGYGNSEQIGDNELPSGAGNIQIGGRVKQIAAGGDQTCALLTNQLVRCWGGGQSGQLGYANVDIIGDDELPFTAGDVPVQ
jgi:alpha-tubulin suppressor-like RCC1 family protein